MAASQIRLREPTYVVPPTPPILRGVPLTQVIFLEQWFEVLMIFLANSLRIELCLKLIFHRLLLIAKTFVERRNLLLSVVTSVSLRDPIVCSLFSTLSLRHEMSCSLPASLPLSDAISYSSFST
jgi:hypothetical protein